MRECVRSMSMCWSVDLSGVAVDTVPVLWLRTLMCLMSGADGNAARGHGGASAAGATGRQPDHGESGWTREQHGGMEGGELRATGTG